MSHHWWLTMMLWLPICINLGHQEIILAPRETPRFPTKPVPRWVGYQKFKSRLLKTLAELINMKKALDTNYQTIKRSNKTSLIMFNKLKHQDKRLKKSQLQKHLLRLPTTGPTWLKMPVGLESLTMTGKCRGWDLKKTWCPTKVKQIKLKKRQKELERRSPIQKRTDTLKSQLTPKLQLLC